MVCYLVGIRDAKYLLNGPMAGALFENYIVQETVKFYTNRGKMPNLFYLRTHNDVEIDLIIEKNMRLYPFEIKLTKSPSVDMAVHIERFRKIFSKLNIMPGNIVCLSKEAATLTSGVSAQSLDSYLETLKHIFSG